MLPDNNPIVVRIEFVLPPQPQGSEGGVEPPVLTPEVQGVADKIQGVTKDSPMSEGSGNKVYPQLDPVRLQGPKEHKEGKRILEKLIDLISPRLQQVIQQVFPRKEKIEHPVDYSNKAPVTKTTSTAKGESLTSDQRDVPEEIEGVARTQQDNRIENPRHSPRLEPFPQTGKVAPDEKQVVKPQEPTSPSKEGQPAIKKAEPLIHEKPQEAAKIDLKPLENLKKANDAPERNLQGARVQVNPPFIAAQPIQVPIFPQPLIIEPRPENRPQEHHKSHVEPIARIEGVQPVQRDPPFRLERNDPNLGIIPIHQDDRDIVRIPLSPDLPLNRQNLFKPAHQGGTRWQEDEGHAIGDIIHMLLAAFICGAETPSDAWRYLERNHVLFEKWYNLKKGIPSYRMLAFVFARLTPRTLEHLLAAVTARGNSLHHLQRIRLWETDRGVLCVQSEKEMHKSSPKEVVSLFDIQNSIIHLDLPALDPSVASFVRKNQGHYLHRVKPTESLYQQLVEGFSAKPDYRDVREGNRTTQLREITLQRTSAEEVNSSFADLKAALRFNSEILTSSKHWFESRIYLTDLALEPEQFAHTLRTPALPHWVEWVVDLDFTDWSCNYTAAHCTRLKQYAWQLLEQYGKPLDARKAAQKDVKVLAAVIQPSN